MSDIDRVVRMGRVSKVIRRKGNPPELEVESATYLVIEVKAALAPRPMGPAAVAGTHPEWFRIVHDGVRIAHMTKAEP